MIEIKGLSKRFKKQIVFDPFDLTLPSTGFYVLEGPNGAGKSTFFSLIDGSDTKHEGEIYFDGKKIDRFSAPSFHEVHCSYIYQSPFLMEGFTVIENLLFPFGSKDKVKGMAVLKKVGLEDKDKEYTENLSQGEKQRLMIAISIFEDKEILLLDEPIAFLDDENSKLVINIAMELSKDRLVIMSTHDRIEDLGYKNFNKLIVEGNKITKSVSKKEDDKALAIKSTKVKTKPFSLFKVFTRQSKGLFITFIILFSILFPLSLTALNMSLSYSESRVYFQQIIDNYPIYNFEKESEDNQVEDLSEKTNTITFESSDDYAFYDDCPRETRGLFSPHSSDEYELAKDENGKDIGKKPTNMNEMVISDLTYKQIFEKSITFYNWEDGYTYAGNIDSFETLCSIPYYFLPSLPEGSTETYDIPAIYVVGVYKADMDIYNNALLNEPSNKLNPLKSYKTTGLFTAPNLNYINSAYYTKGLTPSDLKGYKSRQVSSENMYSQYKYQNTANLCKLVGIIGLASSALLSVGFLGGMFFYGKKTFSYLRILNLPRTTFFEFSAVLGLLGTIITYVLMSIEINVIIGPLNTLMQSNYPSTQGISFFMISSMIFLLGIIPGAFTFLVSLIFSRNYLSRSLTPVIKIKRKEF